jgi:GTP-binding protein
MSEQAKRREKAARRTRVSATNPEGLPTVAVVGRPNVGKSTLVNRIIGRREAIVEERPGVTRDRKELSAEWAGTRFMVVDTGGWMPGGTALDQKVSRQAERAVEDADVALMVVDVTTGPTVEDDAFAEMLRRRRRPGTTFVAVNKVDGSTREADIWAFMGLGLGQPWAISALHGRQVGDLLDEVVAVLPPPERPAEDEGFDHARHEDEAAFGEVGLGGGKVPAVVIAGRPNVGKSTLFNRLIGDERSVVHDMAGTTRDSIDTVVQTEHGSVKFIDTAGMRRRSRVDEDTEYFSVLRALQSIDQADAALFVIDATEGVTGQDQRLAERIDGAGCPIVIVLNKWEVASVEQRSSVLDQIDDKLGFIGYAPVMKISALTGQGVQKLLPTLAESVTAYHRRVPTRALNQLLAEAQAAHPNREARVLYATQGATDPPTFTLFANRELSPPYLRYLERRIREHFGFGATPLKLRVRKRGS